MKAVINFKTHYHIKFKNSNGAFLTNANVFKLIEENDDFVKLFIKTLKNVKFKAFFFEGKPINFKNLNHYFEFVLINAEPLENVKPDFYTFENYFNEQHSVKFLNLGKDALLIAPTPTIKLNNYSHFKNFLQNADIIQITHFIKLSFKSLNEKINEKLTWFSTNGLSVFWLHLRIDSQPKYYMYTAYKNCG